MKLLIISILMFFTAINSYSQTIDQLFVNIPDDMVPQLESAWRKDLIDLYNAGKTATLENTMHGKSTLLKMSDNYLLLNTTERSSIELKLLPLINNTNIICMVTTVYAPVADSQVKFYSTDWKQLPDNEIFTAPNLNKFIITEAGNNSPDYIDAMASLDICLMKYSLNEDNTDLTADFTTPRYLDEESFRKAVPFLIKKPLVYEWRAGSFREKF